MYTLRNSLKFNLLSLIKNFLNTTSQNNLKTTKIKYNSVSTTTKS